MEPNPVTAAAPLCTLPPLQSLGEVLAAAVMPSWAYHYGRSALCTALRCRKLLVCPVKIVYRYYPIGRAGMDVREADTSTGSTDQGPASKGHCCVTAY